MTVSNGSTVLVGHEMGIADIEHAKYWPIESGFVCRKCQNTPHSEPKEPHRWACLHCRLMTRNPNTLFVPVQKVA